MSQLDNFGFVQVLCNACGNKDVWLRCETCDKADHFQLKDGVVSCKCGASYSNGNCLCGTKVPPEGKLEFVPFEKGPMALADLELDWTRVAILGTGLLSLGLGAVYFLFL